MREKDEIRKILEKWFYEKERSISSKHDISHALYDIMFVREKFLPSEEEIRQIISGNKVPGGYTQQQADLAKTISKKNRQGEII